MLIAPLLLSLVPNAATPNAAFEVQPSTTPHAATVLRALAEEGVQAALLPAETRFVAHVDVRAILASRMWTEYLADSADLENDEGLAELKAQLGIDPFTDIHSVTAYGSSPDEDSAAVLVRGTKALETALRRVEGMDGHSRFDVEGLTLHVFDQDGDSTYIYSHDTGRSDERLIVLSPSRTELLRSALVLRGSRNSLATASAAGSQAVGLDLNAPSGTLLHLAFAGQVPGLDGDDPVSGILRMARGGVFSLGESRGDLALHLGIVTESEDQALEMADAVDGLKAVANMLMKSSDEVPAEIRQLLRSFRVNNDESTVFIDFTYPLEKLFAMAEENGFEFDR